MHNQTENSESVAETYILFPAPMREHDKPDTKYLHSKTDKQFVILKNIYNLFPLQFPWTSNFVVTDLNILVLLPTAL